MPITATIRSSSGELFTPLARHVRVGGVLCAYLSLPYGGVSSPRQKKFTPFVATRLYRVQCIAHPPTWMFPSKKGKRKAPSHPASSSPCPYAPPSNVVNCVRILGNGRRYREFAPFVATRFTASDLSPVLALLRGARFPLQDYPQPVSNLQA